LYRCIHRTRNLTRSSVASARGGTTRGWACLKKNSGMASPQRFQHLHLRLFSIGGQQEGLGGNDAACVVAMGEVVGVGRRGTHRMPPLDLIFLPD